MLKTLALGIALSCCVVSSTAAIAATISETARQISVRVISNPGTGSGVIVHHKLNTYTVLTNDHVVADTRDQIYFILTHDGIKHSALQIYPKDFGSLDVALLQFQSNLKYQVATFGSIKNLYIGETIYAAGFPNWNQSLGNGLENTRDWQLSKVFKITNGKVKSILQISLHRGYQIGYSNQVDNGMSGGALLNRNGNLVVCQFSICG